MANRIPPKKKIPEDDDEADVFDSPTGTKVFGTLIRDLEGGLRISKHELDSALIEQPDIFYRVSRELADAISKRDAYKLDLNNAIAELDQQFRTDAAKANEKLTEKALEQEISSAPKIIRMRKEYGQLHYIVDKWSALKEAFQQRSYVLKDLVALYIANYYSSQTARTERNVASDATADRNRAEAARLRSKE